MDERAVHSRKTKTHSTDAKIRPVSLLSHIESKDSTRIHTGSTELDRVLGGGLVRQSLVLISGEPGIGKSTLLLSLAAKLGETSGGVKETVLYISAEESVEQIKLRSIRLRMNNSAIHTSEEYRVENIEEHLTALCPTVLIIDSIQSLRNEALGMHTGTVTQLRAIISACYEWCQRFHCTIVIVAHVTKDGSIAGPKTVEHMVDTVLVFEQSKNNLRFLYSKKNRFGAVNEVGIFHMTEHGLEDLDNANKYFLEERKDAWPSGICITNTYEGSRSFLVEIQALTVAVFSNNRVFSEIINPQQVFKLAAVLERHCRIPLSTQNIYLNTAGGIKIQESGIELAVALALYSAYAGAALPLNTCAIGEVSLAGEIRSVQNFEQRCRRAEDFGIQTMLVPAKDSAQYPFSSARCTLIPVSTIDEAIAAVTNKDMHTTKK
ncbi:DNA repair protein RadA-like [Ylistrum balloti]|uniref:DNA repair protein RadA-like n=1 Tax=Ylistrum balloti TaxID=509963 RepID=UPI002905BC26|nr:DNA repair protein RadA-like [Ylistrum balloti]